MTKLKSTSILLVVSTLLFFFHNNNSLAQSVISNYTYSSSTSGTLEDMSSGTTNLFSSGTYRDDSASYVANIGFNFIFMGVPYTQFSINSNGQMRLGSTVVSNTSVSPAASVPTIAPIGGDNSIQPTGKAHFKVTGTVGNRVLIVEWLDIRIPFQSTVGTYSRIQALLYETTGKIEFKYGTMFNNSTSITRTIYISSSNTSTTVGSVTVGASPSFTTNSATPTSNAFADNTSIANLNSSSDGNRIVYTFTPPATTLAAPTSLNFTSVTSTSMVLNWTAASPTTSIVGYNIFRSDDGGTTYTYQGQVIGSGTVTYNGTGTTSLQQGTTYNWRVQSFSEGQASSNLDAAQATNSAGSTYFWVGTSGGDWNTAGNWNTVADNSGSTRSTPSTSDVLIIDGDGTSPGGTTTLSITTSESIGALRISNSTAVTLQSSNTTTKTITITGSSGTEFDIPSGSSIILNNSTNAVGIVFSTASNMTGNIAGTLTLANSANNTFSSTGGTATLITVAGTGIINNGPLSVITGSVATLSFASGATYNHLHTTAAGTIPTATYHPNSTVNISGYTSNTSAPSGLTSSTFGNFTWNCTNQGTTNLNLSLSSSTVNILGTLTISSTGTTGSLRLSASGTGSVINAGGFAISAGTLDFASGSGGVTLKVAGTFNQSGGTITETGTGTGNTIEFNGTSNQSVTLGTISNLLNYRINNNAGITLTGTLAITTGAGLNITSTASDPISGGTITYTGTTTLTYSGFGNQTMTSSIFPSSSGPSNLIINNLGTPPTNRVNMASIGDRTLSGTFTQTAGVYTLGNNSLTVTGAISGTASSTNFVATNGTGTLKKITTATGTITFPLGDITGTDEASPASVNLTAFVGTSSTISAKVTDAQHPDDASSNDFLTRYWSFTETGATSYTYTATFTYPSADVTGTSSNMRLFARNASTWTSIGSTPSATSMSNLSGLTNVSMPLNSTDFTGRTFAGAQTYVWNQTTDAVYTTGANWTPTRTSADPADILQFSNGATYKVTGITTETIGKIELSNNTNVTFESAATAIITINGGTGDDLSIPSGSSLVIGGATNALTIAFAASTTSQINGTLEILASRTYTATNSSSSVGSGGIIKNAGTVTSSASNLTFSSGAKYQHNYTTTAGTIPTATWNSASTLEFIGYTTNTSAPTGITQTFGNVTWNCASQTAVAFSLAASILTSTGTFTMTTTGAGSFVLSASSSSGTLNCVNYVHNGGTLNFNSSSGSSLIKVSGTITYTSGTITETGTGTTNAFELNGSSVQSIPTSTTLTNDIGYRINNASGVNIGDGTGTLVLNAGAPIIMVSGAITGTITYGATGLLVYNGSTAQTATTVEFPATSGPFSLTVNNSAGLTIPFDRSVGGTLTMTSGNILIGANTLTLGTSATVVGTLTYTAGFIVPTSGKFARWYGASGAPTSSGTTSRFPIGTSTSDGRFVHIFPSSATSFSGGGGVFAVAHTSNAGLTTVTDFVDNTITINRRSNGFWTITTPVTPTLSTGTISVQAQGTNMISTTTVANLRLTNATASIPGGNSTGSGTSPDFSATKPGITTISDITANPIYIAGNNTNIFSIITSIATGNWGDVGTWNTGTIPTASDNVIIANTHVVTAANGTPPYEANNLTINSGGTFTNNAGNTLNLSGAISNAGTVNNTSGTITVASTLANTGTGTFTNNGGTMTLTAASTTGITNSSGGNFSLSSGTITLGPTGGSNRTFSNSGILTVSGGTLNINGNFTSSGTFNQSAGDIILDGNAAGVDLNSVASGTVLFNIGSSNGTVSGGNLTIVDPPSSGTARSFTFNLSSGTIQWAAAHTTTFGNGTSTDASTNTSGFQIDTYVGSASTQSMLGSVVVNAGNGTNRWVTSTSSSSNGTYIKGDLTINSGSEFRDVTSGGTLVLSGNLVNNGTLSMTSVALIFATYSGTSQVANANAQTVSGSGTFRNSTTSPTACFTSMTINNSSSSGVTISSSSALSGSGTGTVSGTLTMTAGILNIGSNTFTVGISTVTPGTLTYTAGQIIGKLKRWKATGTGSLTFNLGSSSIEQRATINFTTGPTTGGSITGEFISSAPGGTQPSLTEGAISVDRAAGTGYWSFSTGDGFAMGSGAYTGTFIAKNFTGVSDFSKLVAIRRDDAGSSWALNGTHVTTTGSNATATLSRTSMTSFGHIGVGGTLADNPLPIELVTFKGAAKNEFNVLNWITATEINSNYFSVEKLNAEKEFESIGIVSAAGNSREINQYQFIDANINKNNSTDYYRLKMVDNDNTFRYSDVIAVKRSDKFKLDFELYPNPSSDFVNIVTISNDDVHTVKIIDMFGKVVYVGNLSSNAIGKIDVSNLSSGLYHIIIFNTSESISKAFHKN